MRPIDADTAFGVLADYYHHSMPIQYMALKEALDRVPTVEAVPERKKTEPNYNLMFQSAVTGLQIAYDNYKTARRKELEMTWVGMDGAFVELKGIGEIRVKASEYLHDVERLKAEVEKYRDLMEGAEE